MKYEIPAVLKVGGGSIVNMASTAGLHPVAGCAGYLSAKFGLIGLTQDRRARLRRGRHPVNALAPGPILTEQLQQAGEQAQQWAASALPMRRIGQLDDVAAAVWLCSPQSSFNHRRHGADRRRTARRHGPVHLGQPPGAKTEGARA